MSPVTASPAPGKGTVTPVSPAQASGGRRHRTRNGGRALHAALLPLALLLASLAIAQDGDDQPIIRARIETETPVTVGQTVTLSVDVLTPSWFPRAPQFPAALHVENAVAVFDESFRVNLSERFGGDTWSGIRRHYLIYPQLAGDYTVPPIEVAVVYALPDARPSEPLTLAGPELHFAARVPPEAARLDYFIAANDFTLEQEIEPGTEGLRIGDAVTRTVTLRATDASSMMLPITEFAPLDGVAVYANPSRAEDTGGERGAAREATRIDAATYVLETEGSYTLPEIRRSWWDVSTGRLRETAVPAVAFDVAPNPDLAGEIALPQEPEDADAAPSAEERPPWWRRWRVVLGLAALALLGWLARRYGPVVRARLEEAQMRRRESEDAYFDRVLAACRRNDARATMQTLLAWVDRVTPQGQSPTVERLLVRAQDDELTGAVRGLERVLYGNGDVARWRGDTLARHFERLRGARRALELETEPGLLAPLNPGGSPR